LLIFKLISHSMPLTYHPISSHGDKEIIMKAMVNQQHPPE